MAVNPDTVGAILVDKTPAIDFLTPSEFGKRLGCGVVGVVPSSADLFAVGESDPLPVLRHPETPFSRSIRNLARRLNSGYTLPGVFDAAERVSRV